VKPELKEKNIQIECHVDPSLEIKITSTELRQVILNLVNNAIQALTNSATVNPLISIDACQHSDTVQIKVTDNGPGILKIDQANLFEILISTKQSGMGLGLWLCQYMISRHSGSIHYEDALGGGARFVIKLPHTA
jgi:signal transduction histidine kinase